MNNYLSFAVIIGVTFFIVPENLFGQDILLIDRVGNRVEKGMQVEDDDSYEDSIEEYAKAIKIDPNNSLAYDKRGVVYTKMLKFQKALNDFNKAISIDSTNCEFFNHKGVLYFCQQKTEEAIDEYNKALTLKPDYAKVYYNRAIAKFYLEDEEGALIDLKIAADMKFKDAIDFLTRNKYVRK